MKSYGKSIVCGVPQGSALGQIIFNWYINDMFQTNLNVPFVFLFICYFYICLCTNTLSINVSKTNFRVFSKSKRSCIPGIHTNTISKQK